MWSSIQQRTRWAGAEDVDLPLAAPRDVPDWMESFHFFGYDPAAEVGFWCNLSSSQWDHSVWREVVILFLPRGQLLVGKAWGGRSIKDGPSSAGLTFNYVEPQRSWRIEMNSALQPVAADQTFRGRVSDDARIPAGLSLDVTCTSPPWRLPFRSRSRMRGMRNGSPSRAHCASTAASWS